MQRKSKTGVLAALSSLVLAACGPAQVIVTAELDEGGSSILLNDVEVQLLPYDRDHVFDSLTATASVAEPEIPQSLLDAQNDIAAAQQAWLEEETSWNTLRDTLQTLNRQLESLNRGESRYRQLFNAYGNLERQYQQAERRVGSLFDTFQSLQAATIGQMDSVRIVRANWADQAFADVDMVIVAKIQEAGLDPVADTTEVEGHVTFDVPPGRYWVYARFERPYDELYWNVPIDVVRGEPFEIRLSEANAEERPLF